MTAAELIVAAVAAYLLLGLVFALVFVSAGLARFDPDARGTSIAFRVLILPGTVGLWPLLAAKWIARTRGQR